MAGYGDELIGAGLARGAWARGKKIGFGDGRRIIWGPHSAEIFKGNPNIAHPGTERDKNVELIHYRSGHRIYNRYENGRWIWNYEFRPKPGEVFLDSSEREFASGIVSGLVVIEPNVLWHKSSAVNKDWGLSRYQAVADQLKTLDYEVAQFAAGRLRLCGVTVINAPTFRHALAVLRRSSLLVAPEGGLHHGAAAVGTKAVVLFGGFIPPQATGYDMHVNLTGGAVACGSLQRCEHCRKALAAITVDEVVSAARVQLS